MLHGEIMAISVVSYDGPARDGVSRVGLSLSASGGRAERSLYMTLLFAVSSESEWTPDQCAIVFTYSVSSRQKEKPNRMGIA